MLWLTLEVVGVVVIVIFSLASDILPGAIRVDFCYPCVTPVVTRCHSIVHLAGVVTPTQHGSAVGTFSMRYKVIHIHAVTGCPRTFHHHITHDSDTQVTT